jgi:hypothetical protein
MDVLVLQNTMLVRDDWPVRKEGSVNARDGQFSENICGLHDGLEPYLLSCPSGDCPGTPDN